MPEVLITGGAGFLGRNVAAALAREEVAVTVLDDLSAPGGTMHRPELQSPRITLVRGSILDAALVKTLVQEHSVIVHFASVVGVAHSMAHPALTIANLQGTTHIVEALRSDHRFVFGSSADVYGMHSRLYDRRIREDDHAVYEAPEVLRWVYPKVKALEETLSMQSAARTAIARIFNSYGPGMDYPCARRVLPQFIECVFSETPIRISLDGRQRRAFCYYEDTVRCLLLVLRYLSTRSAGTAQVFNIGNPESATILQVAELVNALAVELGIVRTPVPIQLDANLYDVPFDDSWHRIPEISRAKALLGYEPATGLRDGVRSTLLYYRNQARGHGAGALVEARGDRE